MPDTRFYKFLGKHKDLITGHEYTVSHYSEVTGILKKTLQNRIYRYGGVVDDKFLEPHVVKVRLTLETEMERVSMAWLRKPITNLSTDVKHDTIY